MLSAVDCCKVHLRIMDHFFLSAAVIWLAVKLWIIVLFARDKCYGSPKNWESLVECKS